MLDLKNNLSAKIIVAFFCSFLIYVVAYKAIHLPITHDEKSATVYYATWDFAGIIKSDCWPSNHILNSLLIKVCENLWGIEPWSVRLPNVISMFLFLTVLYLVAVRYFSKHGLLFCLPFILFCNPFLVDFYGLARGYGMSNAFLACSVYSLLLFSSSLKQKWYYLSIVFAMLAAYANFTLLIYWAAVQILLAFIYMVNAYSKKEKISKVVLHLFCTALLAAAFLALSYEPLYKMSTTNQFVYWAKESFYHDTFQSVIDCFFMEQVIIRSW